MDPVLLLYVVLCVGGNLLPCQVTSYTDNWFGVIRVTVLVGSNFE